MFKNKKFDWRGLLLIHLTRGINGNFMNIFLGIYFFQLFEGNLFPIMIFYIFEYLGLIVFYHFIYSLLSNNNLIKFFRISFVMQLASCSMLLFLKENIVNYIYFFAVFYSFAQAAYWATYQLIIFENNKNQGFQRYFSYETIIGQAIGLVFPTFFGFLIEKNSYEAVFAVLIVVVIITLLMTVGMPKIKTDCNEFDMIKFFKRQKKGGLALIGWQNFFSGLTIQGILGTFSSLVIFSQIPKQSFTGVLNTVIAFLTMLVIFINKKSISDQKFAKMIIPIMFLIFLVTIPIPFTSKVAFLVLYNVVFKIGGKLVEVNASQALFKIQSSLTTNEFRDEYLYFREVTLNLGRIMGILIIIVGIAISKEEWMTTTIFFIFSALYIVYGIFLKKMYRLTETKKL